MAKGDHKSKGRTRVTDEQRFSYVGFEAFPSKLTGYIVAAVLLTVSAWAGVWVASLPDTVSAVKLVEPVNEKVFTKHGLPTMGWTETAGDSGRYIIEYASEADFKNPVSLKDLIGNKYMFSDELPNGEYHWRVYAVGKNNFVSEPSDSRSFTINVAPVEVIDSLVDEAGDQVDEGISEEAAETLVDTDTSTTVAASDENAVVPPEETKPVETASTEVSEVVESSGVVTFWLWVAIAVTIFFRSYSVARLREDERDPVQGRKREEEASSRRADQERINQYAAR